MKTMRVAAIAMLFISAVLSLSSPITSAHHLSLFSPPCSSFSSSGQHTRFLSSAVRRWTHSPQRQDFAIMEGKGDMRALVCACRHRALLR